MQIDAQLGMISYATLLALNELLWTNVDLSGTFVRGHM